MFTLSPRPMARQLCRRCVSVLAIRPLLLTRGRLTPCDLVLLLQLCAVCIFKTVPKDTITMSAAHMHL